jgi:hypothetical protein
MNIEGNVIQQSDSHFHDVLMGTLFNKIHPGRQPDTIVEPQSVQDIIETIHYAKRHGKRVTICSGGHSWSANHLRNNSILLKMSRFNAYEINAKEMTAKAGPAVGGSDLLAELYKQKLFFPVGHCKGVCIGGYLLQGGFGWHGRKLGMACENVIGLDIVTADGELVHASESENVDLFWAARGSGGGFFGVVVCFHLKLHPLPPYRGIIMQNFDIKHLEEVYEWAYHTGKTVSDDVEFQLILCKKTMLVLGAGIEVAAPIFANTKDEYHEAARFMLESPIKKKARIALPSLNPGMNVLFNGVMSHYPNNHHWGVDNMWTNAPFEDLLPHLKEIYKTLPPPPSHVLWLNWHPTQQRQEMVFSNEDRIYIALYGAWKDARKTAEYGDWATNMMQQMSPLSTGIQLADENLHKRTAPFLAESNYRKIAAIRADRDPHGIFHEWHSKPELPVR